jgi:hypothetical protein
VLVLKAGIHYYRVQAFRLLLLEGVAAEHLKEILLEQLVQVEVVEVVDLPA